MSASSPQAQLTAQIRGAIRQALGIEYAGEIPLERPKNRDHGDYASSIALQLTKSAGKNPREIATALQKILEIEPNLSKVEIAGPGFINFTLNRASQAELIKTINRLGQDYGKGNSLTGLSFNVEFISANPTGPLHLGHTRWAAVGDALARVLAAAGAKVTREFYINDRGVQMELFGESVRAAALGKPAPEDGYQGAYIADIAKHLVELDPEILKLPEDQQRDEFRERAYQYQLALSTLTSTLGSQSARYMKVAQSNMA